jgi:hypothetical protein
MKKDSQRVNDESPLDKADYNIKQGFDYLSANYQDFESALNYHTPYYYGASLVRIRKVT